jgi:hypothetical protein
MVNYGLVEELHELGAYFFGSSPVPAVPFQEDGNWEPYLPVFEHQAKRFETSGCAVFGTLNQIETLSKRLYGYEENYSERFTYLLAGVDPKRGIDPQKVYESIRKDGVIENKLMPMTRRLVDFLENNITGSLLAKGQYWLRQHDFRHEWLWTTKPDNWREILRAALKTSPIAVSVKAWEKKGGRYISSGDGNNHWCMLYRMDDDGTMWVYDHYDVEKKPLHKDHHIRRAKRIWLQKRTSREMRTMISILKDVIKKMTMKPTLADVANKYLGKDVTPKDEVSDDVACASTLTTLMKELYKETPHITGTWTLWDWLSKQKTWQQVNEPQRGDIIISPTGSGIGIGHCGVVMDNGLIASNNSFGVHAGKLIENYTIESWGGKYAIKQKMPVYYFRRVL